MEITLQGPKGPRKAWLTKVALVSSFHTSIASLKCFIQKDVHWNTQAEELTYQGKMYCKVPQRHGQWVLEYHPLEAAFPIRSTDPCLDSKVSMDLWHQRLGHLHKEAIERLSIAVEGAKIMKNLTFSSPCEVG